MLEKKAAGADQDMFFLRALNFGKIIFLLFIVRGYRCMLFSLFVCSKNPGHHREGISRAYLYGLPFRITP
jgi:hypothetical protein